VNLSTLSRGNLTINVQSTTSKYESQNTAEYSSAFYGVGGSVK
jgi:hypothetical protein